MVRRLMLALRSAFHGRQALVMTTPGEEKDRQVAERRELELRLEILREKANAPRGHR